MMHNSIWVRDRLKAANQDPLHRSRRDSHRSVGFEGLEPAGEGVFKLEGSWCVDSNADMPGISELTEDLADFLAKMGVKINNSASRKVHLDIDENTSKGGFHLTVNPTAISIAARDMKGLWAGAIYLEREMGMHRGPFLAEKEIQISPPWEVQISQSPWGSNYLVPDLSPEYLSNDAFLLLAHYGINGMTIYGDLLFYLRSQILPELNHQDYEKSISTLRNATERAARYGISLYWVPVLPKLAEDHPVFLNHPGVRGSRLGTRPGMKPIYTLCSSSEESLAFYAEVMENLFREVPLLGGLILIIGGESYYHCYMRPADRGHEKTNCPLCALRTPEEVVAGFVDNTAKAVHRAKPEAPVLAWPYSAFVWSRDPNQVELIGQMSLDSGLLSEIDKDHCLKKEGYNKRIWDYSVDFVGPSDRILVQSNACRSRGLPLFVKTETALGLEAIHMPYVPSLHRLAQKWQNVRDLEPDGVLQSWMFYGMWGSRAEELGWWTSWHPEMSAEECVEILARRDFGPAYAAVLEAWEAVSRAVSHLPCIPPYFAGPWFLGPAHPLLTKEMDQLPDEFMGTLYYLQENEESLSRARLDIPTSLVLNELPESPRSWGFQAYDKEGAWEGFMAEMGTALDESAKAFRVISKAENSDLVGHDRKRLHEEVLHVEFFHRTLISVVNALEFLMIRDRGETPDPGRMEAVVRDELENALLARHIYDEAPWLDISLRVDAGFPSSRKILETKIGLLRSHIDGSD